MGLTTLGHGMYSYTSLDNNLGPSSHRPREHGSHARIARILRALLGSPRAAHRRARRQAKMPNKSRMTGWLGGDRPQVLRQGDRQPSDSELGAWVCSRRQKQGRE